MRTRVLGVGLTTPVGDGAAQTAASVRAGICRYRVSPVHGRGGRALTLALLPEDALPPLRDEVERARPTARAGRMLRLAAPALAEALGALDPAGVPLFLAVPEALPGVPAPAGDELLDLLRAQSGAGFDRAASAAFPAGRAGALQALAAARAALENGSERVLVGGADTHLDLRLLAALDAGDRVLADGVTDGFVPGEGAGFLLLGGDGAAAHGAARAELGPPGLADEAGHRYADAPCLGDGLAAAVESALEGAGEPVRTVLASLNGEHAAAKEWGVAAIRHAEHLADDLRVEHPAECHGDLGAATAPVLLGLAALGLERGWLAGPCLVWCASELEARGAALVTIPA